MSALLHDRDATTRHAEILDEVPELWVLPED